MFELTGTVLERIIFAMEDQTRSMLVDMNTGDLIDRAALEPPSSQQFSKRPDYKENPEVLQPPPKWTPKDGFKMMESFYSTLRNEEFRVELSKALTKGKGVFKAFKEIIASEPEEELAYKEFKLKYMRPVVQSWIDDYREWKGLERLGAEPEDIEDIILSDFPVEIRDCRDMNFSADELIETIYSDSLEYLPLSLARSEKKAIKDLFTEKAENCFFAYIKAEDSSPLAFAFGSIVPGNGNSHGLVRLLFVKKGYRNLELPSLLLKAMLNEFHSKGIEVVLLDSLFMSPEYQEELLSLGYTPVGVRMFAPRE